MVQSQSSTAQTHAAELDRLVERTARMQRGLAAMRTAAPALGALGLLTGLSLLLAPRPNVTGIAPALAATTLLLLNSALLALLLPEVFTRWLGQRGL